MSLGTGCEDFFSINHQFMRMHVINERVGLDTVEVWSIKNQSTMAHPIHVHGVSFRILSRNGASPPSHERGWKDVVIVHRGETVRIVSRFEHPAGEQFPFIYHCHILEHEDNGMMGQFTVKAAPD
ncbi:MAG: multicopper oxidase domain-containing protein [Salinisphaera sp.]|jgi:blue copper oxidase|nr:multicopper oxidase domain-containing protein [Salinisphaera sp.]